MRGFSKFREKFTPLEPLLREARMYKLPEEVEKIQKAIAITHEAFTSIHDLIRPGVYEYEIEARFAQVFRSHHATEAYP
jgi:Xaa-Pro aminopeptidase